MSSHHIVREKQEPALLVLGMDNFSDELLGQLLEWSPTVIVTEMMAEKLNALGIKVDWIMADNDSGDIQSDVKLLPLKYNSTVKTAFEFLLANNYPAVNIVTDEFELNNYTGFLDRINIVVFYNHKKIYTINPGFSKWSPAGEIIEFLGNADNLQISGLDKTGETRYKTMADGIFSISFTSPYLFIAEHL